MSLGLEGLYYLARAEQDAEAAGTYTLQVLEVDSKALWALDGLMILAVQIGDWPAAEKWLRRWGRAGRSRGEIKRRAIWPSPKRKAYWPKTIRRRNCSGKKGRAAAMLDVKLLPATALAARLLTRGGHLRKHAKY